MISDLGRFEYVVIVLKCFGFILVLQLHTSMSEVKFLLHKPAIDAFRAALKKGTKFELGKTKAARAPLATYLTASDFKPSTVGGRNNIKKFVEAMKSDFDSMYFPLVVKGEVGEGNEKTRG